LLAAYSHVGPIVRINPEELHILDFDFYDTIYAKDPIKRDKWALNAKSPDSHYATGFTLDHDLHKKRRDVIAPFFNKRNIQAIEPEIQQRVDYLCGVIEEHQKSKSPINLTIIILALSM
jgi:cytochrome P450